MIVLVTPLFIVHWSKVISTVQEDPT